MAKVTDKPVPQKRSKATTEAKTAPKASQKSQEYVVDSDDDDVPAEEKKAKKVVSQSAPVAAPAPEPVSKGKEDAAKLATKDGSDSEEDESGSEDSSEDVSSETGVEGKVSAAEAANGTPVKVNGVKSTSSEASSSSDESEDSSEDEVEEQEPAAKRTRTGTDATRPRSEANTGAGAAERSQPDAPASKKQPATEENVSGPISAKPWAPPSGYVAFDLSAFPRWNKFASSSLEGKQIWHITAPSEVPLASISEVALDSISAGRPVLNHNGIDYVLSEAEAGSPNTIAFAPGTESFTPIEQPMAMTLQLQQQIILPKLSDRQASQITGSAAAASIAQASITTVRPQPRGLRMRYRPPGYGEGEPGTIGSDSDSAERDEARGASETFQFPRALGAHGASEQHDQLVEREPNGPAQQSKKKRKEKDKDLVADNAMVNGHVNGTNAATSAKVDGDVTMTDAAVPPKPSKEDKARRKEEKRLKKEDKAKGRAL